LFYKFIEASYKNRQKRGAAVDASAEPVQA
jgi:hypothetical protein